MFKLMGLVFSATVIVFGLIACAGTPLTEVPSPEAGETLRADFAADPSDGTAPLTVHFRDKSTGAITHWQWDFGNGESSELQNPDHQYKDAGKYTVYLTVTGGAGSATKTIENCILVKHPYVCSVVFFCPCLRYFTILVRTLY